MNELTSYTMMLHKRVIYINDIRTSSMETGKVHFHNHHICDVTVE